MRNLSILVLALAVVLGVVAVMGVRGLINNQRVATTETPVGATTTVVVARTDLNFGTELTPEVLREIQWASTERPDGSFEKIGDLLNGERRVALRSISPGELILSDRVSGFGGRATLSNIIAEGYRAVTIRINDVSGAGGFILPGDRVDLLLTVSPTNDRLDTITDIILRNVRVLAIDQLADDGQEGAVVGKAATVEVLPEDAQRIALASSIGTLSLTLRNIIAETEEDETEKIRTIRYRDLGPAKEPEKVTRRPVAPSPYASMRVTRGTSVSNVGVIRDRSRVVRPQSAVPATPQRQSASKIIGADPAISPVAETGPEQLAPIPADGN